MKRWHMVFDVEKCVGCYTCFLSCKDEHVGNDWLPYTERQAKRDQKWIKVEQKQRGVVPRLSIAYRPALCNHCSDPPCAKKAPGAFTRREDGIVMLKASKAHNKDLVDACPYGAISWNEDIGAAQKCTFCAHLIDDGWKEPRCVQSCPLRALKAFKMEDADFEQLAKEKGLVPIVPEAVGPRVWYKNLHQYTTCMIAGEIAYRTNGEDNDACANNVEVLLRQNGQVVDKTHTSDFGEFRFDKIEPGSGKYEIEAEVPGQGKVSASVEVAADSVDTGLLYAQ